jgi:hypothetical protein
MQHYPCLSGGLSCVDSPGHAALSIVVWRYLDRLRHISPRHAALPLPVRRSPTTLTSHTSPSPLPGSLPDRPLTFAHGTRSTSSADLFRNTFKRVDLRTGDQAAILALHMRHYRPPLERGAWLTETKVDLLTPSPLL